MRLLTALALAVLMIVPVAAQEADPDRVVLAVHGGAGTIRRANMTPETDAAIRAKLEEALRAGHALVEQGRPAMDAVIAAIQILEADPHFNAGRGAVYTAEGGHELDASVMDGASGQAGAVAGVRHIASPIEAARAVMEHSVHVLLTGDGAEEFALQQGLELVPNTTFNTEGRRQALERVQQRERDASGYVVADPEDWQMTGTVGAVVRDADGHLAAGTSTGGMTNKRFGRVGDSPIIGAGTYAEDATAAVSATGHGEFFIRNVIAFDVAARMRYLDESLEDAAEAVIMETLTEAGGTGGIIALDAEGHVALPFNTEGMYRGYIDEDGNVTVMIYGDE